MCENSLAAGLHVLNVPPAYLVSLLMEDSFGVCFSRVVFA